MSLEQSFKQRLIEGTMCFGIWHRALQSYPIFSSVMVKGLLKNAGSLVERKHFCPLVSGYIA
ncbi:MAG: hypothetical protein KDD06_09760, partial [Phaeodactylibacter sp.]|nr:hypothetical protein [Phaeodactylibacter sp.]